MQRHASCNLPASSGAILAAEDARGGDEPKAPGLSAMLKPVACRRKRGWLRCRRQKRPRAPAGRNSRMGDGARRSGKVSHSATGKRLASGAT